MQLFFLLLLNRLQIRPCKFLSRKENLVLLCNYTNRSFFSYSSAIRERKGPKLKLETETARCELQETSWAVVIRQSLLGRG